MAVRARDQTVSCDVQVASGAKTKESKHEISTLNNDAVRCGSLCKVRRPSALRERALSMLLLLSVHGIATSSRPCTGADCCGCCSCVCTPAEKTGLLVQAACDDCHRREPRIHRLCALLAQVSAPLSHAHRRFGCRAVNADEAKHLDAGKWKLQPQAEPCFAGNRAVRSFDLVGFTTALGYHHRDLSDRGLARSNRLLVRGSTRR